MTHRAGRSPPVVSTAVADRDRRLRARLALELRTGRPRDRARHAAAVQQLRVRRVGDRVDLERRDVDVEDLDHSSASTRALSSVIVVVMQVLGRLALHLARDASARSRPRSTASR